MADAVRPRQCDSRRSSPRTMASGRCRCTLFITSVTYTSRYACGTSVHVYCIGTDAETLSTVRARPRPFPCAPVRPQTGASIFSALDSGANIFSKQVTCAQRQSCDNGWHFANRLLQQPANVDLLVRQRRFDAAHAHLDARLQVDGGPAGAHRRRRQLLEQEQDVSLSAQAMGC